jgi:hypothetical protein
MKKLVLTAFAAVLLPTLVSAQGTVAFTSVPTTDPQGPYQRLWLESTAAPAGAGTTAQLWWSPDNVVAYTNITGLLPVSTTSGRVTPGVVATTGTATPGGNNAWFYVYGENTSLAVVGQTPHFLNPTANPAIQPPPTPPFLTGWDQTVGVLLLHPVPEPSVIALAGLGLASLLIFLRRK